MTKTELLPVLELANRLVDMLNAAGYEAQIVGGAYRTLVYGGTTGDIDIAVLVERGGEANAAHRDITSIVLPKMGFDFEMQHGNAEKSADYATERGYIADYRCGCINIILYDIQILPSFNQLRAGFDLNINQFYKDASGLLVNDHMDSDTVRINPERNNVIGLKRLVDRIARFKVDLPHLDWREVDAAVEFYNNFNKRMGDLL